MAKITVAARAPYSVGDVVDVLGPYLAFTGGKRGVDGWTGKRMTVLQVNGLDLELARPGHDSEVWLHAGRCEPVTQRVRWDMTAIRAANALVGGHWFDRNTLRFFRSQVLRTVYQGPGGVYFVSSEQFDDTSPRRFTVRQFDPATGDVDTFGEFNELGRAAAVTLAKLCASGA